MDITCKFFICRDWTYNPFPLFSWNVRFVLGLAYFFNVFAYRLDWCQQKHGKVCDMLHQIEFAAHHPCQVNLVAFAPKSQPPSYLFTLWLIVFLTLKEKQQTFPIFRRGRLCCRYMGIFKVQEWNWFHRVNLSRPVWGCPRRAGSVLSFLRRCGWADLTLFWCSRPCSTHSQRNYVGGNAMWFSFLSRRLWSISSNEPYLSIRRDIEYTGIKIIIRRVANKPDEVVIQWNDNPTAAAMPLGLLLLEFQSLGRIVHIAESELAGVAPTGTGI